MIGVPPKMVPWRPASIKWISGRLGSCARYQGTAAKQIVHLTIERAHHLGRYRASLRSSCRKALDDHRKESAWTTRSRPDSRTCQAHPTQKSPRCRP